MNTAFWATGQRGPQVFSSYGLACRDENDWRDIGRAEGLAQEKNYDIIQRIASESLLTGRGVQARTGSAMRQGIALLPAIVVTVRFEDVVKDSNDIYSLRDPKIVHVRPRGDSAPEDADSYATIRQLYMKKKTGLTWNHHMRILTINYEFPPIGGGASPVFLSDCSWAGGTPTSGRCRYHGLWLTATPGTTGKNDDLSRASAAQVKRKSAVHTRCFLM